jgi:hypothetical protein
MCWMRAYCILHTTGLDGFLTRCFRRADRALCFYGCRMDIQATWERRDIVAQLEHDHGFLVACWSWGVECDACLCCFSGERDAPVMWPERKRSLMHAYSVVGSETNIRLHGGIGNSNTALSIPTGYQAITQDLNEVRHTLRHLRHNLHYASDAI